MELVVLQRTLPDDETNGDAVGARKTSTSLAEVGERSARGTVRSLAKTTNHLDPQASLRRCAGSAPLQRYGPV